MMRTIHQLSDRELRAIIYLAQGLQGKFTPEACMTAAISEILGATMNEVKEHPTLLALAQAEIKRRKD